MDITAPQEIIDFMKTHERFFIISHKEPDGDCIGSSLALAHFLVRIGKAASGFSPGPFMRPEIDLFKGLFSSTLPGRREMEGGAVIVVDCSTLERIGSFSEVIAGLPVAVIDHHSSGDVFGDVRYILPEASSVSILIQFIIETWGSVPDKKEAEYILFGLCTDTGFFRHLEAGTEETFKAVARLVSYGASPKAAHLLMYGGRSLESRILLGRLLARSESHASGKIIYTYETLEEKEEFGTENRDSDTLYQNLQGIKGCEVVVLIREEAEGECSVGLRANKDLDVGEVAFQRGGGGHRKAAGYTFYGSREDAKREVLEVLTKKLKDIR